MITRYFNEIIIDDNYIFKISTNEKLADEIFYYEQIQKYPQKYLFADYFGNYSNGLKYILKIKYYENHLNFYEYCNIADQKTVTNSFIKLLSNIENLHLNIEDEKFPNNNSELNNLNKYILFEKTINEYEKFVAESDLNFFYGFLTCNNKKILNFNELWPQIKKELAAHQYLNRLSLIHGDLCLSNILINEKKEIVFIDPRGSYHMKGCYGFYLYDYAKLLHSLHGNYESIIYDRYQFKQISYNQFEINIENKFDFLNDLFKNLFDDKTFNYLKLIEGLLFISMCSRHKENIEHQKVMYLQGLKILNECIL